MPSTAFTPFAPPAPLVASRRQVEDLDPKKWSVQPKYNGVRVLLWRESLEEYGVWSRHKAELTRVDPELLEIVRCSVMPGTILDGEWVPHVGLYLFDVVMLEGIFCGDPLWLRLTWLSTWSDYAFREDDVWARGKHIEGVVAKPMQSMYVRGYSTPADCGWLKYRY